VVGEKIGLPAQGNRPADSQGVAFVSVDEVIGVKSIPLTWMRIFWENPYFLVFPAISGFYGVGVPHSNKTKKHFFF
jgi:hypothetical protein